MTSPSWKARDSVYMFTNEQEVSFRSPLPLPLHLWPYMAVFLTTLPAVEDVAA